MGTHKVPVTMYVDPPYPEQPPRCFVTPPPDMIVRARHPHVDANGTIRIPYLRHWRHHVSSLAGLLGSLTLAFSAVPPLCEPGGFDCGPTERAESMRTFRDSRPYDLSAVSAWSAGSSFKSAGSEHDCTISCVE